MDSFVGEIRILPYTFAPNEWAWCNGQQMAIQQNTTLFSIIGTLYGGNGTSIFNLPNLSPSPGSPGANPMGQGAGPGLTPRSVGEVVGASTIALQPNQMPLHNHTLTEQVGLPTNLISNPSGAWLSHGEITSPQSVVKTFVAPDPTKAVAFRGPALSTFGQGQPHQNMQPYLPINFCISLAGYYPPRQ
jgi:microcystin-dependent protein